MSYNFFSALYVHIHNPIKAFSMISFFTYRNIIVGDKALFSPAPSKKGPTTAPGSLLFKFILPAPSKKARIPALQHWNLKLTLINAL